MLVTRFIPATILLAGFILNLAKKYFAFGFAHLQFYFYLEWV